KGYIVSGGVAVLGRHRVFMGICQTWGNKRKKAIKIAPRQSEMTAREMAKNKLILLNDDKELTNVFHSANAS
ncbi:hypothetical protein, partial [Sporolactobacillus inulinus]|uniref:hypothetical protein n=1 Tax=Sporolactobacillus inulinus TaxID=2078 RepID=UPI001C3FA35B